MNKQYEKYFLIHIIMPPSSGKLTTSGHVIKRCILKNISD